MISGFSSGNPDRSPRTAKALKPDRTWAGPWRGGRVIAINGDTITIRVRAEHVYVENFDVDVAVFASGHTPSVNGACVVRVSNAGAPIADYIIVEARCARYCGKIESSDEHENFGHVEFSLTSESEYWE